MRAGLVAPRAIRMAILLARKHRKRSFHENQVSNGKLTQDIVGKNRSSAYSIHHPPCHIKGKHVTLVLRLGERVALNQQCPVNLSPPRRGRACPARNLPAVCRQSSTAHPFPKPPNPATLSPPTPIICARQPPSPQYTPCPNFTLKLCRKNQKNLQKPVDKGHTTCYNNQAVSRAQPAAAAAGAFTYSLYAVF